MISVTESVFNNSKIDREKKIIKEVSILGCNSLNGYVYSSKALDNAVPLFEGCPAFFDHSKGSRTVMNIIGSFSNVHREGDRLKADLNVLDKENWLFDLAERMPNVCGFSIDADAEVSKNRSTGKEVVESIVSRRSVDLVTVPATVRGLFESAQKENMMELEEFKKFMEEKFSVIETKITKLEESVHSSAKSKEEKPQADIESGEDDATKTVENVPVKEDFKMEYLEAVLPKEALTDVFKKQLLEAKTKSDVISLVEDRKKILASPKIERIKGKVQEAVSVETKLIRIFEGR